MQKLSRPRKGQQLIRTALLALDLMLLHPPAGTGSDTDRVARDQVSAGAGKEATLITHRENSNEDKAGPEDNQLQRQKQNLACNTSGSPAGTEFVNRFSLIMILDLFAERTAQGPGEVLPPLQDPSVILLSTDQPPAVHIQVLWRHTAAFHL